MNIFFIGASKPFRFSVLRGVAAFVQRSRLAAAASGMAIIRKRKGNAENAV